MAVKFSRENIANVLIEHKQGKSIAEIARITGNTRSTIYRYLNTYLDLFPTEAPTLTQEEVDMLNKQALEVVECLEYKDRDHYGRKTA